jgi:hypothetical protein
MSNNLLLEVGTNALIGLSDVDKLFLELKESKSNYSKIIIKLEKKLEEIFGCKFIIEIARSSLWSDNCGIMPIFKKTGVITKKEDLVKLGNIKNLNIILGEKVIKLATPRELTALFLHEIGHIVNHIGKFFSIIQKSAAITKMILFMINLYIGSLYLIPLTIILTRTLFWTLHMGEYNADKFVAEYGYGDEFITLSHKFEKSRTIKSENTIVRTILYIYNFIFGSTHPTNKDRINKVAEIMKNDYADKYKLDKKTKKILDNYTFQE